MSRLQQTYYLIKALTRGEKRFFNLYSLKYSKKGKNNITQLFDIYDSVISWDKRELNQKISKTDINKYASVINNKLLEELVTSLRLQEEETNIDFIINRYIEEAKVLFQREIYDLALHKIKKAKKIAKTTENFEKLIDIYNTEKFISVRLLNNEDFKVFCDKNQERQRDNLLLIENKNAYRELSDTMFYLYRKYGKPIEKKFLKPYQEIIDNILLTDINKAISTSAKSSFCFIYTIYHLSHGNLEDALEIINSQLIIIEESKEYFLANLDQSVSVLNNALFIYSELGNEKKQFETAQKIRELPDKYGINSNYFDRRIFETTYSMELDFYLQHLRIDKANSILPIIINKIEKYDKAGWSLDRFMGMAIGISFTFYYQEQTEEAHKWVDRILEKENEKSNIQVLSYSKILDLILHYERKNYTFLIYRANSAKRFLKNNKHLHEIDENFIKLLFTMIKNPDKIEIQCTNFIKYLNECPESPTKMFYFRYLRIEQWCISRYSDVSFYKSLIHLKS